MSLEIIDVSRTIAATLKRNIKVPIQDLELRLACVLKRREGIIAYLTSPFFFFVGSMAVWGCFLFSSLPVFYWLLIFTKQKDAVCVPFVISFCLFSFPVISFVYFRVFLPLLRSISAFSAQLRRRCKYLCSFRLPLPSASFRFYCFAYG